MRIGNDEQFVELNLKEVVPKGMQGANEVNCSVKVACDGFRGEVESVWFQSDDIARFLEALENFERKRQGSVELTNMSSISEHTPLVFEIFSIDELGHLGVRAELQKPTYTFDRYSPLKLSVSFEVDPGMLRTALDEFRELFSQ